MRAPERTAYRVRTKLSLANPSCEKTANDLTPDDEAHAS
jgi:hypothetical protein